MMRKDVAGLSVLFTTSGIIHLVRPGVFEPIIPSWLKPWKRELVLVSGVAELGCAALMVLPPTRRLGGLLSAGLLVAVFPANLQMTADVLRNPRTSLPYRVAQLARLPLQWPMIRVALKSR